MKPIDFSNNAELSSEQQVVDESGTSDLSGEIVALLINSEANPEEVIVQGYRRLIAEHGIGEVVRVRGNMPWSAKRVEMLLFLEYNGPLSVLQDIGGEYFPVSDHFFGRAYTLFMLATHPDRMGFDEDLSTDALKPITSVLSLMRLRLPALSNADVRSTLRAALSPLRFAICARIKEARKLFYTFIFIESESKTLEVGGLPLLPIELWLMVGDYAVMQGHDLGRVQARSLLDKVELANHSVLSLIKPSLFTNKQLRSKQSDAISQECIEDVTDRLVPPQ